MLITSIPQGMRIDCPAKLNLFLDIHGKRPDGFHELETVMVTVGLFDTLVFREEKSDCVTLRCLDARGDGNTPDASVATAPIPTDERNLVVRAANLLKKRAGVSRGVSIDLYKRIPSPAGLAGGSSDAAATLATLNRFWSLGFSSDELISLAAELGSDIPFFLASSPLAVCRGRGELISPMEPAFRAWSVIVSPWVGLSTADVFRQWTPSETPRDSSELQTSLRAGNILGVARNLHNSLQPPAEQLCPLLVQLARSFETVLPGRHQMSGSGTSWFGLCESRHAARQAAARLNALRLGRVFVAETCPYSGEKQHP